jgi:hypothetical protein
MHPTTPTVPALPRQPALPRRNPFLGWKPERPELLVRFYPKAR